MSQQLKSNDLRDVLRELLPAQNNWKNIGLELGLQDYEVNAINGSNQPSALREMLSKVFNKKYLTWGELINVLRDPNVSCDALANELATKYDSSKYLQASEPVYEEQPRPKQQEKKEGKQSPSYQSGPSKKRKTPGEPRKDEAITISSEDNDSSDDQDSGDLDPLHDFRYEMNHRQALIINIVEYLDQNDKRDGSDMDTDSLTITLRKLGYTVHVEDNLTSLEIIPNVVKCAKKDKNCDSFICCILTHGDRGVIKGSDGKLLKIENISKAINKVENLRGKPKIFFFQVCQGNEIKDPMVVLDSVARPAQMDMEFPKLPPDSDFFYGFASSYGTPAMRDPDSGSLYIKALCQVTRSKYRKEDLLTMVTRVHYLVAKERRSVDKGNGQTTFYQQQPQLVSTLRKIVHFA